jgi:uncharacterized FAD-dependent dehydrogenase
MFVDYRLSPSEIHSDEAHQNAISEQLNYDESKTFYFKVVRRNIDARGRNIQFVLRAEISEQQIPIQKYAFQYRDVSDKPEVHIIGAGPCGYFAALQLIELGLKPIVIERGKDVRQRRRDLRDIQQFGKVNPDSNYCFGEGGAGTYSDGKLYTRSNKRGDVKKILHILIDHGAEEDILIDVHPHIGSNKLPEIVNKLRNTIEKYGGEVHFNSRLHNFIIEKNEIKGFETDAQVYNSKMLILATGHSARSIYENLYAKKVLIECKPFALGVRIEHPQSIIDEIQYKQKDRNPNLPASSYSLSCQVSDKGVFSFCMCPGGLIIPSATAPGEIVVNGMSLSRRDSPYANSGMVTSVDEKDFKQYEKSGPLMGMLFQHDVEKRMFDLGDGSQKAPAQRLTDFLRQKPSADLPSTSYIPGIFPVALNAHFSKAIEERLRKGLNQFCQKMPMYLHKDAILVATESRTSAPVKIPRDPWTFMHPQINGLYPAGEGAGYAGGILSAAMDGQNVAMAVYQQMNKL